jgi:hyperosmotically inducible protein
MNLNKKLGLAVAALAVAALTAPAAYASSDAWITTKAKVELLTADGAGRNDIKVETDHGVVTIHGKVESQAVKDKATGIVSKIDGVKSVRNLVEVVPDFMAKTVKASDHDVKECVEAGVKAHKTLDDVNVDSVDNGVVLLGGKARSLDLKLVAIETAYACPGTRRVASKIETDEK